jgi:hypothetical protein
MSSKCIFENIDVASIDTMLFYYPKIISTFLKIFEISYCFHDGVVYTPEGSSDDLSKYSNDEIKKCNCKEFLFELNFLYYLYESNRCMILSGKMENQVLSNSRKTVILEIRSENNIENVDVDVTQETSQKFNLINIDDPTVQNTMSTAYLKTLMAIITAFEETGLPKNIEFQDKDLEEKIFNTSGYKKTESVSYRSTVKNSDGTIIKESDSSILGFQTTDDYVKEEDFDELQTLSTKSRSIMEESFENIIKDDFEKVVKTMLLTNQIISVTIDIEFESADFDVNQSSLTTLLIENISDNMIKKFFTSIFVPPQKKACFVDKVENVEKKKESDSTNSKFFKNGKLSILGKFLLLLFFLFVFILSIVLIMSTLTNTNKPVASIIPLEGKL